MDIAFTINGKEYVVNTCTIPLQLTLNAFIRQHAHLTGTKYMCLEGGCGACVVSVSRVHPLTQHVESFAINSCLKSLYACNGYEVTTIEALGNRNVGYHPLQTSLTRLHGSQCGFCTGGMIMNMYALLERQQETVDKLSMDEVERSFGGNICRCTGYRPILEAFRSFGCDASVEQRRKCHGNDTVPDIEDFAVVCAPRKRRQRCASDTLNVVRQRGADDKPSVWYEVTTLSALLKAFDRIGEKEPYQLVVGNTARGISWPSDALRTFIYINDIAELHTITATKDSLTIGAAVTLTDAIQTLRQVAATQSGFEYCAQLAEHYELIANVPVRNVGSLGGNLCYKQQHPEFPSDVFLTLDTVDARLTICDRTDARTTVTMQQFLALNMRKRVLYSIQLSPIDASCTALRTYKIMIRAQNAHAYVNAGFNVRFAGSKVLAARICYGGIAPDFTHAARTESKLLAVGDLYTDEALQQLLASLDAELHCDWVLPDAQPAYRKQLAMALFYRFVLSTCKPANRVAARNRSGGWARIERPLSMGTQDFQTERPNYPLTEPLPKYEGLQQASGEARYFNDMPALPGELFAVFAVATRVHCRIGRIDASAALAVKGVRFVYTAKDIPGKNSFTPKSMFTPFDEKIFVGINNVVTFNGHPVGVVLAESQELAEDAAKLVKITYIETIESTSLYTLTRSLLNPLLGIDAGRKDKPIYPTIHDMNIGNMLPARHDVSHAAATATLISGRFELAGQYHYHMETHITIAVPNEERARSLRVYCSTQWVDLSQRAIAGALNIPQNHVQMKVRRVGGAFGSRITRGSLVGCAAALGAFLSQRPVRFSMGLQANMRTIGKRFGLIGDYRVDVDPATGRIQNCTCTYVQDSGCSLNESVVDATTQCFRNCYDAAAWTVTGTMVLTDAASNTFCRSPGTLEGIAMGENMMEHIAIRLGLDPMQVRLSNMKPDHPMRPMIGEFMDAVEFARRRDACDRFNAANRWRKRGIAAVPMSWPLIYAGTIPAYVAIYHGDGSVVVTHGGIECGQGINTKVVQVVAFALGVPVSSIEVKSMDTVTSANAVTTGGSCTSEMVCYAAKRACEAIVARMQPVRATMKAGYTWAELVDACYEKQIDLRETYQFKEADVANYDIYGMCACEMEVDVLTGNVQLRRVDLWEDVGESLSPLVDVGQVEGAFVMGIGYWLTEQLVYDRNDGRLLTDRTWTYKPPGAMDIPVDFRIKFISKSPNPKVGVLRSKATGEPATCMSVVIIFALRNAINSARRDAGITDPWFALGSAQTPEQVFMHCANATTSYKL